ncbi:uncharacterized protein LOC144886145 [Branchiostoma floridae x Branchiostoma japonicum]
MYNKHHNKHMICCCNHPQLLAYNFCVSVFLSLFCLPNEQVFTEAMSEYVSSADSREEKNRRIVHLLQSRDDPDFFTFCEALRENQSQAHLWDLLQGKTRSEATGQQVDAMGHGVDSERMEETQREDSHQVERQPAETPRSHLAIKEGLDLSKSVLLEETSVDKATKAYSEFDSKSYRQEIHRETRLFTHTSVTKSHSISEMKQGHGVVQWQAPDGGAIGDQRREGEPIPMQLSLADPSIRSGTSAVVRGGLPVILTVNGEVDDAHWLLNNESLPLNKGINVRTSGLTHELEIDNMTSDLAGTYTCQGTTPKGAMLSCDIKLILLDPSPSL